VTTPQPFPSTKLSTNFLLITKPKASALYVVWNTDSENHTWNIIFQLSSLFDDAEITETKRKRKLPNTAVWINAPNGTLTQTFSKAYISCVLLRCGLFYYKILLANPEDEDSKIPTPSLIFLDYAEGISNKLRRNVGIYSPLYTASYQKTKRLECSWTPLTEPHICTSLAHTTVGAWPYSAMKRIISWAPRSLWSANMATCI
jgi:hypothetical protein